ncbi:DNA-binding protein [Methylobacterium sp. J-076]|uniref:DNA-binding protein n=1 Tax=Methylobacterium sp. J-076 TaxID=2836655 RepID=UPI001FB984F4|nr:DNA-binding protein [Methylobacterium sp. J-076]MCJ2014187.1 DNA-binding protein [Methylobacterium sp. J-076]
MPERDAVFLACDRLLARRERVSLRNVIAELPRGGSNRAVGPHMAEWKVERDYKPGLEVDHLPEGVQGELVKFAFLVVEAAKEAEAASLANDRGRDEARRRANDEMRDEALAALDVLTAANARLTLETDAARQEAEALRTENVRLRERLDRIRAEEFWDRVMREVRDLMPVGGSLPMDEILAGLRPSIHRGARLHREPLDAGTLRKKMMMRVRWERFFEAGPDGTIVRKAAEA